MNENNEKNLILDVSNLSVRFFERKKEGKAVDNISPIAPLVVTTDICRAPSTNFPSRGETICRRSGESLPEVVRHSL